MLTSTSPGASYQRPAMIPYPVQAASPPNAWALTVPAMPGTLTPFPYSVTSCRVPGWARSADTTAASCAAVGICPGPAPGPNGSTCTGIVAEWLWLAAARLSEELSPNAKITAVAPNATAASVTAVRAGRANGAARPRPAGLGSRSRAASRCAAYPRPARGARPAAIASAADSRPARSAGPNPASSTSANIPAGAMTEAHQGTCWLPTP